MNRLASLDPAEAAPASRRRRIAYRLVLFAALVPAILFVTLNMLLLHVRRETFERVCTRQAGVYVADHRGDWIRTRAPDCRKAGTDWTCALDTRGLELRYDRDLGPFIFSGGDDFGYRNLGVVPRISYWRGERGELVRLSNFAVSNLDQWDFGTMATPAQHLCFPPVVTQKE